MISFTIFQNLYDNKTHNKKEFNDYDQFEEYLYDLSKKPLKTKTDAYLITPAIYKNKHTRKNDNVLFWAGWAAVDVDDIIIKDNLKDTLLFSYSKYRFTCYSTASSTVEHPKFRIIFPLKYYVENIKIKQFWYALQMELGEIGDKQTNDLSRMYYVPATYDNAYNFIFSNKKGEYINPNFLIEKYPSQIRHKNFLDRLPEDIQKKVIENRKNKMDNHFTWTSYQDCPFWPKKLADEYKRIVDTGWYAKMYSIMVAIAGNAISKKYDITSKEVEHLCRQFDIDTGNWYGNRRMDIEADRAIEYVYRNGSM